MHALFARLQTRLLVSLTVANILVLPAAIAEESVPAAATPVPAAATPSPQSAESGGREKIADLLQEAEKLGIGVNLYRLELAQIEEAAKRSDTATDAVGKRVETLTRTLTEQIRKIKVVRGLALPSPALATEKKANGLIITQASHVNRAQAGEGPKMQWVGQYIFCTKNGFRLDTTLENGLLSVSKAPDWVLYSCFDKTRTYTRGLEVTPPKSELEVTGDARTCYSRIQVKGPSPPIAGMKTKHYKQFYDAYDRPALYAGEYIDGREPWSEWFTADPQFLPAELKMFTKRMGSPELHLRSYNYIVKTPNKPGGDALYDSAKRIYIVRHLREVQGKELSFDTISCKRTAIPASAFEVPAGYRYLPPMEFAKQLMPGWILELDRGNPKDKQVFPH